MTLFPHSIAGPIVRYGDIAGQIAQPRRSRSPGLPRECRRFIIGLAKKMLVANTVAVAADAIFALPGRELNFSLAWLGVACYTLQIYFDFSGYSDMAIGLAKLFGIDFLENFNYPYAAGSITEFWRRWHISLSSWFRDYLYIPLGGNRCGRVRNYFNLVDRLLPVRALARRELDVRRLGSFSRRVPGSRADEARPDRSIRSGRLSGICTRFWSSQSAGCSSGPTPCRRRRRSSRRWPAWALEQDSSTTSVSMSTRNWFWLSAPARSDPGRCCRCSFGCEIVWLPGHPD